MRKKILSQSMLILLIMIIGIFSCIPDAHASQASITAPSGVKQGDKYTVTVVIPSDAVGYKIKLKITYSDGTTDSAEDTKMTGFDGDYKHPGNMTATFTAKAVGKATIETIDDSSISNATGGDISLPGTVTFNIAEKVQEQPKPADPTPTTSTTPTTPSTNTNTTTPTTTTDEVKFTDVNETVYTTDRVNLRKSWSTSSEKITTLAKDTKLTRTGVASNGWSRVNYNGQTAYIYTQYLAKDETQKTDEKTDEKEDEVKFTDVSKTMYAKQNCNLRKSWSTKSDLAGYLTKGEEVTVTGTADNGWTRIKYKNQDIYVATRLLVDEKPEDDEQVEEEPEENQNESEVPVEKTELEKLQEEIGVLPEVGNNIATEIYILVATIALAVSLSGLYYIKKEVK